MKIIFLDIDGVLNNRESLKNGVQIVPDLVLLLEDICDKTGAKIVISSSWRILHSQEEIEFVLNCAGLSRGSVIGYTPRLSGDKRGEEIKAWMDEVEEITVDNFVILDDDSDMLPEQMDNFIQVDRINGLSGAKAAEAVAILRE
jgi:hypothetical protein